MLKTWHKVAGDKVIALMGYDLVSAKNKWAAGIKELRELFIRVEQDGFTLQSQAVWRLHWDHQIHKVYTHSRLLIVHLNAHSLSTFWSLHVIQALQASAKILCSFTHLQMRPSAIFSIKAVCTTMAAYRPLVVCTVRGKLPDVVYFCLQALAYQYRCSLESVNDDLAQIDISLAVKQGRLQFEPLLEEIHAAHYKNQLRPLLAIPLNFKVGLVIVWTSQTVCM